MIKAAILATVLACVVVQVCQECPLPNGGTKKCNCEMKCLPGT